MPNLAWTAVPWAAVFGAAAVAGCGGRPPAPAPPEPSPVASAPAREDVCLLVAPPTQLPDTVTIVVTEAIDSAHAPVPRNPTEQMLFNQLYEPLVRFDCTGAPLAAAAERWSTDAVGQTWTVTLAGTARFWHGTPVTAADVVAGWGNVRWLGIEAVSVIDERRIALTLTAPSSAVPAVLGDPALAVRRYHAAESWPEGSGRYRPAIGQRGEARYLVPAGDSTLSPRGPVVAVRRWPGPDLRDALDGGADLLVTDEPAALTYAGTRDGFSILPLAADRTYGLVSTAALKLDEPLRIELARDAVDVAAQPATVPAWWNQYGCTPTGAAGARGTPAARIVYPRGDRVARALAERLVALKVVGGQAVSVGLDSSAFTAALGAGREAAYVFAFPKEPQATCAGLPTWPAGAIVEPLIDTRKHAIIRNKTVGLSIDASGQKRLEFR